MIKIVDVGICKMITLKKWFICIAFLVMNTHLVTSENSTMRDSLREQIYKHQSFAQGEFRQVAGCAGIIGSLMVVNGIRRCLWSASKRAGLLWMFGGVISTTPMMAMIHNTEREINRRMRLKELAAE